MLVRYFDTKGKEEKSKFTLNDSVFNTKYSDKLLAQAVSVYLGNQRQSNANTKNRGEVRGGGKKPWRQKGTGRARAGSSRSPIWKGGGVTFGPTNEINYKKRLNKKMIKKAIVGSFSKQAQDGNIIVFKGMEVKGKTSELLKNLGEFAKENILLIQNSSNKDLFNAAHNVRNIKLEVVNALNYYSILNAKKIIIIEDSLETIYKYWAVELKKQVKKEVKAVVKKEKELIKKPIKKAVVKKSIKK